MHLLPAMAYSQVFSVTRRAGRCYARRSAARLIDILGLLAHAVDDEPIQPAQMRCHQALKACGFFCWASLRSSCSIAPSFHLFSRSSGADGSLAEKFFRFAQSLKNPPVPAGYYDKPCWTGHPPLLLQKTDTRPLVEMVIQHLPLGVGQGLQASSACSTMKESSQGCPAAPAHSTPFLSHASWPPRAALLIHTNGLHRIWVSAFRHHLSALDKGLHAQQPTPFSLAFSPAHGDALIPVSISSGTARCQIVQLQQPQRGILAIVRKSHLAQHSLLL